MEMFILTLILIVAFFFVVYIPTILFLKGRKIKNNRYNSLVLFFIFAILYLMLTYLCVNFYELKAIEKMVECNVFTNINCFFADILPKLIRPELSIYMVMFLQLIVMGSFCYYTVLSIMEYNSRIKVVINLVLFFLVSILSSVIHFFFLYDAMFVSGLKYISLFSANAYIVLPFMYLVILTYLNRNQLKNR